MGSKTALVLALVLALATGSTATTYYVSKNGTSGDGRSWTNAWTTISQVNSGISSGDTVLFGTGLWYGTQLKCVAGTPTARTVYACSSFVDDGPDINYQGEYHYAKIWASNPVTTSWSRLGADVWRTPAPSGFANYMAMGHTGVGYKCKTTIDGDEQFYVSNGYLYVRVGVGLDPNDYEIHISTQPLIDCETDAAKAKLSYVTLYGLDFAYGYPHLIEISMTVTHFRVEHCKLVGASSYGANNPALWYSGNTGAYVGTYNAIVACSLGYAFHETSNGHGCGLSVYSQSYMVVDSCTFFGKFDGVPLIWKNDTDYRNDRNIVRNCLFTPSENTYNGIAVWVYRYQYDDSIYANVFAGALGGGVNVYNASVKPSRNTVIYNNTFICAGHRGGVTCTDGDPGDLNTQFKYNIIYKTATPFMAVGECIDNNDVHIDSNIYVAGSASAWFGYNNPVSQSYWVNTLGHDRNSVFYSNLADIGFTDFYRGDYSRNPDTTEMNLFYGGRQWLYYGANLKDDNTPPDAIDDLRGEYGDNHGQIELAWTAPADSESVRVSRYEIMCSPEPLTGLPWKPTVTSYSCHTAGTAEYLTVSGLEPGLEYYVAIKSFDQRGLASLISNIVKTFAGGIMIPPALFTAVDGTAATASLSCDTVSTYYDQITYDFILIDSSTGQAVTTNLDTTAETNITALFEGLSPEAVYYWHCRAVAADIDSSDWSFPKMFRLGNVYPDPPTAYSPLDMDTLVGVLEALSLVVNNGTDDDSTGQLSYDIELYELDASFPLADTSGLPSAKPVTSWSVPVSLEVSTTFQWRARSYDGLDYSFWSDWFQFTLVESSAGGSTIPPGTIIAYPNPVHFRDGEYVTFKLPDNPVDLLIQTVSGETVLLRTGISGDWQWFGENGSGNMVATGIYSWFVRGTNQNGKIVVKP